MRNLNLRVYTRCSLNIGNAPVVKWAPETMPLSTIIPALINSSGHAPLPLMYRQSIPIDTAGNILHLHLHLHLRRSASPYIIKSGILVSRLLAKNCYREIRCATYVARDIRIYCFFFTFFIIFICYYSASSKN